MDLHIALPAFELDCRDWLIATEEDGVLDEEICEGPVLAVLSTVVIEEQQFFPATVVLSVALIDEPYREYLGIDAQGFHSDDRLADVEWEQGNARYFAPSPDGGLALMAEFSSPPRPPSELAHRFHRLMGSFRWAA